MMAENEIVAKLHTFIAVCKPGLVWTLIGLGNSLPLALAQSDPPPIPQEWTATGAEWRVHVKQYHRTYLFESEFSSTQPTSMPVHIQDEFDMVIRVLEPAITDGQQLARLAFIPAGDADVEIKKREFEVRVASNLGDVRDIKPLKGGSRGGSGIEECDGERHLVSRVVDFPLNWITRSSDLMNVPAQETVFECEYPGGEKIRKCVRPVVVGSPSVDAISIDVLYTHGGGDESNQRVTQTWVPGEYWWRTFRRYQGDYLDLEAELILDSFQEP